MMQTLPGETLEQAIYREGSIAAKAFVDRMSDTDASAQEGLITLSCMLVQVCGQCMRGDLDDALSMLGDLFQATEEGLPPFCDFVREYYLVEKTRG